MSQSGRKGISALINLKVDSSLMAWPFAEISVLGSTNIKEPKGILSTMSSKAVMGRLLLVFEASMIVHWESRAILLFPLS